jgi:hypothetical protein
MITIRTKNGDTIEITEHSLWPEDENDEQCFCGFVTNIRVTGFLLLPHIYIPAESIAVITRDPRGDSKETGKTVFN